MLRELVALEDDAGRPVTIRVPAPLHEANQRLMDCLGVIVEIVVPLTHKGTEKATGYDGTKTISEIEREMQAFRDAQPMSGGCGVCGDQWHGSAAECREQAAAHRSAKHPDVGKKNPAMAKTEPTGAGLRQPAKPPARPRAVVTGRRGGPEPARPVTRKRLKWPRHLILQRFREETVRLGHTPTGKEWSRLKLSPSHQTIRNVVSRSWVEVCREAGVPEPAKSVRSPVAAIAAPEPAEPVSAAEMSLPDVQSPEHSSGFATSSEVGKPEASEIAAAIVTAVAVLRDLADLLERA